MSILYDAVNPANIPDDALLIGAYIDGRYANDGAMAHAFPNARILQIATRATTNAGDVLDVETGDATPAQAPAWVTARRAAGHTWPTIYCNLSTWSSVIQAFQLSALPRPLFWIADWGPAVGQGTPHIPPGAVACQYDHDLPPGYDISETLPSWPPPSEVPVILAAPIVSIVPTHTGLGYYLVGADGGLFAFGDANGAMAGTESLPAKKIVPVKPITGAALTPSGNGLWLCGADGGVFDVGDAVFYGSVPGLS